LETKIAENAGPKLPTKMTNAEKWGPSWAAAGAMNQPVQEIDNAKTKNDIVGWRSTWETSLLSVIDQPSISFYSGYPEET
jgi:hypothetical protein